MMLIIMMVNASGMSDQFKLWCWKWLLKFFQDFVNFWSWSPNSTFQSKSETLLQCFVFFFVAVVVLVVPETHILIQFKAAWLVGCRYNFEGFFLNPCRALGSPLSWFLISSEFELTTIFNLSLSFSTNFHTTWATMEQLLKGVKKTKCLSTAHI